MWKVDPYVACVPLIVIVQTILDILGLHLRGEWHLLDGIFMSFALLLYMLYR